MTTSAPDWLPAAPAWFGDALCSQIGGDGWFPDTGQPDVARDAKRVCARCPVRETCLAYALDNAEPHGVWGGMTARQRQRLSPRAPGQRRSAGRPQVRTGHGTEAGYTAHRRRGEQACAVCREGLQAAKRRRKDSAA